MPSSSNKPVTYDSIVESKQKRYRSKVKPTLQNEADITSFMGGGRTEKVAQQIMYEQALKQAKASHGRAPIVVDVAFRDEAGIYHYDEEQKQHYKPLLLAPPSPAHAHAQPYTQTSYPAWIDMGVARRGSIASVGSDDSNHYVPYADAEELQSAFGGAAPSKTGSVRTSRKHRRGSVPLNLSDPYATAPTPMSASSAPRYAGTSYAHDARRDFLDSSFAPPPRTAPSTQTHFAVPPPPMPMPQQDPYDSRRARRFTLTSSSSSNVATAPPPIPMSSIHSGMYGAPRPGTSSSQSVKSSKSGVKSLFKMGRKA